MSKPTNTDEFEWIDQIIADGNDLIERNLGQLEVVIAEEYWEAFVETLREQQSQMKQAIITKLRERDERVAREPVDIRCLRKSLKVTQQDMAVFLDVSRLTYLNWEKDIDKMPLGKYLACVDELNRLAALKRNKRGGE